MPKVFEKTNSPPLLVKLLSHIELSCMFIDFTILVFLSYVCNIVDMLKRFKLNFHLDERFTSTDPITYVREESTYVDHYREDPDYMCEFDIYKLLSEIGMRNLVE